MGCVDSGGVRRQAAVTSFISLEVTDPVVKVVLQYFPQRVGWRFGSCDPWADS